MDLLDKKESVTCAEKSRKAYIAEQSSGILNYDTQFEYALDLLKTKDSSALGTAESLLENCFMRVTNDGKKRECLFLIAIAAAKMGHYEKAIECCDNLLGVNSQDHQTIDLRAEVEWRRRRDGTIGLGAIGLAAGGVFLGAIAALAGYGIQKSRERR